MKLSKKNTTVTPLSKKKAIILIILFLFLGFYLGIKYQEIFTIKTPELVEKIKEVYPECIASLCPTFTSADVTGQNVEDTIILIPTAMTQGAGKIIIMKQGKKIFDSGELPNIGFEELTEGNGFILKYSSAYDENFNRQNYQDKYVWKDGQFKIDEQVKCESNNGIWMKGPFGEEPFCNKTFSDGGKKCNDSKDCLSQQCIVYSGEAGECADKLTNYGCYGLLVRNRITEYACRD